MWKFEDADGELITHQMRSNNAHTDHEIIHHRDHEEDRAKHVIRRFGEMNASTNKTFLTQEL